MTTYRIGQERFVGDSEELQRALERAKTARVRPLCLCREGGVAMYIAAVSGKLLIKRMPNSGGDHSPACDSYEPPVELSGLGQVMGTAIQEDPDAGVTALKLDFSLTKTGGRAAPVPSGVEADSVKTDGNKLTLRGTLHYLWEQAGFNRWSPAMEGRRPWFTVRKFLLQGTEGKITKGASLSDVLYIPEAFYPDRKAEIIERRMAQMSRATTAGGKGARRLMLMIGEVKEISESRFGHKVVFKQVPDYHFMLNNDIYARLVTRFEVELGLWDAHDGSHLMAIATFGVGATGIASIEEMALMATTSNWIPIESTYDMMLIDAMTEARRRFVKGLRYNLGPQVPLACVVASDTYPDPTAMYIVPPDASQEHRDALEALMQESKMPHWVWSVAEGGRPELPAGG